MNISFQRRIEGAIREVEALSKQNAAFAELLKAFEKRIASLEAKGANGPKTAAGSNRSRP